LASNYYDIMILPFNKLETKNDATKVPK